MYIKFSALTFKINIFANLILNRRWRRMLLISNLKIVRILDVNEMLIFDNKHLMY